jgi:co-chaperonin GroES (HSP10)
MGDTVRPIGPWNLIKPDPVVSRTKSGLYLPEGNLEERLGHNTGVVVAVGQGDRGPKGNWIPSGIKVGDRVYFRGYLQELNLPGGVGTADCLIHTRDIVGTVDSDERDRNSGAPV